MSNNGKFLHRPISVTVDEIAAMDTMRTMPAEETLVIVNVKLDRKRARSLAKLLLETLLVDDASSVNLITFSLHGKLK